MSKSEQPTAETAVPVRRRKAAAASTEEAAADSAAAPKPPTGSVAPDGEPTSPSARPAEPESDGRPSRRVWPD